MGNDRAKHPFIGDLRRALSQLYNPGSLRASPLVEHLGIDRRADPVGALRRTLIEAIEALRPAPSVPPQANAWRVYHVLTQRYVEQFTQKQVATDLALSIRQLRRLEHLALRELADYLQAHYHLAPAPRPAGAPPQSSGAALGAGWPPADSRS